MKQSTITFNSTQQYYVVTRPNGETVKCMNLPTAQWYVRNPTAR